MGAQPVSADGPELRVLCSAPEAVFTGPDHVMFAKACGQVGYDFEKIGKIMGRPQW